MAVSAPAPTLVILRALKLGDLVTAVPAIRALARAFPLHRRVLCMPTALAPLVPLILGVDEVADTRELGPISPSLFAPDVAVNLHGRGPQSTARLRALEPHRLVAWGERDAGGVRWRADEHERDRWCRLLRAAGIAADAADYCMRRPRVSPPAIAVDATVIHPGASSEARRWPAERFAAVARHELACGHAVVITGNDAERALACEVARRAGVGDDAVLAGRQSLTDLAATVAAAGRVCSNDTGVAHLATAFGRPSVVLFGPVPPAQWGPPPGEPRHRAIWKGRYGDPHADAVDAGLLEITVGDVLAELQRLPAA